MDDQLDILSEAIQGVLNRINISEVHRLRHRPNFKTTLALSRNVHYPHVARSAITIITSAKGGNILVVFVCVHDQTYLKTNERICMNLVSLANQSNQLNSVDDPNYDAYPDYDPDPECVH